MNRILASDGAGPAGLRNTARAVESLSPRAGARGKLALHYAGIHHQEDRDARFATKAAGAEKEFWHMVRVRAPVGMLSAQQYLALDDIAGRVTYNRSLRVTTGQSIQLHGVREELLEWTGQALAEAGLAAGCHPGGFEFAVAVSPVPVMNESYLRLRGLAADLCDEFYRKPAAPIGEVPQHSPRKFTVGLSLPEDNTANVLANDAGLLLVRDEHGQSWLNVFAGGSLSMPSRRPDTYARLGSGLGAVCLDQGVAVVRAMAAVFKRHGELPTKRFTRLKYVVDRLGVENFRGEVEAALGFRFAPMLPTEAWSIPPWAGPHEQGDGNFFYGMGVPFGRIQDAGLARYRTAIRMIVETFEPRVILAPDQNIIFAGLRLDEVERMERILAAYHVPYGENLSNLRFEAMACAGLPTCPMALAESERVAPQILDELERELERAGRGDAPFSFRISGCSIGCIRPNMVDLGAIGRKPGHYDLYVGGSEVNGRFGELYAENVPLEEIVPTMRPLLEFWGDYGAEDESFGDFYTRWFGPGENPVRLVACELEPGRERIETEMFRIQDLAMRVKTASF